MTFNMIFWSFLLLVLVIFSALTRKNAANYISPKTAPIFNFVWVFIGLIITFPLFRSQWLVAYQSIVSNNWILLPVIIKGFLFYYVNVAGMKLTKNSLSASNFILPAALSVSPFFLMMLGEHLSTPQFIISLSLGFVGIAFFMFGHVSELNYSNKFRFIKLSLAVLIMIVIDYIVIDYSNWIILLLGAAITQMIVVFVQKFPLYIWKEAMITKHGFWAGLSFGLSEFVLFYQLGAITPVTIAVAVKSGAIPFVQLAASIIWKERNWKEQVSWGMITTVLLIALAYFK